MESIKMSSIEDLDSSSYLNGSGSKITVDGDELKAHSDATDDESDIAEVPEALLWKKSFEHHILIDIGSDGGSQFVDRQDSFIFRFSQDSAEDDTLCITDDTDNFSFFDNGKDEEHHEKNCENPNKLDQVDQMKDSVLSLSEQKPNTQENMSQDCGNATDKQERSYEMLDMSIRHVASDNELLKLASLHMPLALSDVTCSPNPQSNSGENYRIHIMGDCERIVKTECEQIVKSVQNTSANEVKLKEVMDSPNKCDMDKLESPQTKISGMLLQHFTEDDQSIKFIEAETLTETSLTESMEETIHSQKSCTQKGEEFTKFEVEGPPKYNIANESFSEKTFLTEMELKQSEETCCMDNIDLEEEESELENTPPSPKVKDNDCLQNQKIKLVRASSFNRLKYGQGQVHYPLPDFSKVAPRIKIPKGSAMTETVKPSSSNFKRAVSSPGLLSKCSPSSQSMVDVVKKVLDTMQPNYALAFRDGQEADADLQQIPIQIPLGIMNAEITSDFHSMSSSKIIPNTDHHGSTPRLPELSLSVLTERKETHLGNMNIRDGSRMVPTEGEKMAESLKEMINLLTLKVEEFKHCLGNGALIIEEQQQVFKSLMAIQDKLERSYISQKEWHRTLELRKDMGKCKNIGDFDPENFPLLPEEAHLSSTKFCSPGSPCLKIDLRNKPDSVSLNDAMQLADLSAGSTIDHWTNSVYSESSGANGHKGTDSDESSGSLSASPCGLHYRSPKSRQSHNLSERCCRFCSDKHSTAEEDLMSVASEEEDEHPSRRVIHEFPTCPHNVSSCSLPASNYPSQMASAHVQRDSCLSDSALLSSRLYRRPTSITNPSLQNAYSRYRVQVRLGSMHWYIARCRTHHMTKQLRILVGNPQTDMRSSPNLWKSAEARCYVGIPLAWYSHLGPQQ
ncbi:AKND1 protein, partial [Polypterus senegalus]